MKIALYTALGALLASSALAQWDVEPPTTADPSTIADCTWWHVAASGETCSGIPTNYFVTEAQFRAYNPVLGTSGCALKDGNSYCVEQNWGIPPEVPTTSTAAATTTAAPGNGVQTPSPIQDGMVTNCNKFYFVKLGDGCANIASQHGISLNDFYTYNPAVGSNCGGLWASVYVCVGIIGQTAPSSTLVTVTTTTAPSNGVQTPQPTQPGMVSNCNKFAFVNQGTGCADLASQNGISVAQLYTYNTGIGTTCGGLWANVYVCVGVIGQTAAPSTTTAPPATTTSTGNGVETPQPTQPGMVSNCNKFAFVNPGSGCADIASQNGISTAQLISWNSGVGASCGGLWANVYVCVGIIGQTPATTTSSPPTTTTSTGNGISTPQPTQPGMVATCNKFAFVNPGSGCADIASQNGISLTQLYTWNTGIGNTCSGLWANVYVCVGVVGSTPVTTTPPTTTTAGNGVATPTPIQAGMTTRCNRFYFVVAGDGCAKIAQDAGISLSQFLGWNPAVGAACTGLWAQYYVCTRVF